MCYRLLLQIEQYGVLGMLLDSAARSTTALALLPNDGLLSLRNVEASSAPQVLIVLRKQI
jgi:hypothetical protein